MLNRLICLILGYFIGAIIQTGFWIGRFNHIDIRDYGSGNAGTTNTMRTLGKKAGFITYFMDAFKSCITAIIIHFIYGSNADISEMLLILYGGFGVVLGHNFPFYLGFKGGKGIAVLAGLVVATHPVLVPIPLACFLIASILTRYVSLGSLLAATTFFMEIILYGEMGGLGMSLNYRIETYVLACVIMVLAWFRHKENIKRLIAGTENRFGSKK